MPRKVKPVFRFGFSNAVKTDRFPEKVYEVATDDYLIHWNSTGTGVFVEEEGFADSVMECYPGFLQIADFMNLRRLFREYGFDWEHNDSVFEFSHPSFIRGRPELLSDVLTRRKSYRKPGTKARNTNPNPYLPLGLFDQPEIVIDSPTNVAGRMTRRGFVPFKVKQIQKENREEKIKFQFDEKKAYKIHERPSLINKENRLRESDIENDVDEEGDDERLNKGGFEENKLAIQNIINVFAINELSPEEFLMYIERQRSNPILEDTPHINLPLLCKKNDENVPPIPMQCDFQMDNFAFTQIRPASANVSHTPDDFLQQEYQLMENIPLNNFGPQMFDEDSETSACSCCRCCHVH